MDDFLKALEIEGLTSRLKRLSDTMLYETKDLYKSLDLEIEPNWNLIFRLLQAHQELTIMEISERLQLSHPAVIKIVNKMKKTGYILTYSDKSDKRKQILRLSEKAMVKLRDFESIWEVQNAEIGKLLSECPHFMEELEKVETKLREQNYKQRILNKLNE